MNLTLTKPITVPARSVASITGEIVYIAQVSAQNAYAAMVEMGKRLEEVKELLPAGEWGSYCENELPFSQRTASNYMKIFRDYCEHPDSQAFANLDYAKIVRLLSMPYEDREQLMQENDVQALSSRDLDKLVKERDDIQAAKDASDAKVRDLEQQLLDAQQQTASAKSDEAAWKEQIDKLTAARDKALADVAKEKEKVKKAKSNPDIPAEVIERLANEAAENAAKEYEAKLADAQAKCEEATAAKNAAEQTAQDLQQKMTSARNASRVSTPEAAAFAVLYPQVTEVFNKLNGCQKKVAINDPELGDKLLEKMRQLVADLQKAVQ